MMWQDMGMIKSFPELQLFKIIVAHQNDPVSTINPHPSPSGARSAYATLSGSRVKLSEIAANAQVPMSRVLTQTLSASEKKSKRDW
jgi:hypothetical protein